MSCRPRTRLLLLLLLAATQWACAARTRCGPGFCEPGTSCCNDSCGLCTGPEGYCISPLCTQGPGQMCASSNPNGSLYDHIDVRGGLAYQKLRTDGAPGVSYRGPFAHLEFEDLLEQDLVREDVALRGRLSLSRLSEDPGVDPGRSERAAWSAGTGAALTLPAPWILMPNVAGIDAEFNQGRGFASQLRPQSLGNLGSVTLSPSLMWWFLPGRKLSLNVHGRYVHTMVSGPGDLGLLEAGVSVLPFWALDVPHVRLHYRYAHELTRGSFREHEVGASTWLQWDFLHLGAEGATRFTRLSSTRTGHSLSGSIRLEVYWDLYL